MASTKLQNLVATTTLSSTDVFYTVINPATTPLDRKITLANLATAMGTVTIGSTAIALGGTATTIAGLTSVTSTTFVGALTGNASTASAVAASGITGTTLAANVVTSSLTTVGTIGSGTWQGTAVSGAYLDLSVGVAGGRTLTGGTASGDDLTLSSTSNGTKGNIFFGTSTYDEVNNRLGVGTVSPLVGLDLVGAIRNTALASSTLTGTADPTASTTLVGSGTLFLTELVVGDRITINAETRTVTAIASDTSLTVSTAFTDTASASITKLPAIAVFRLSTGAIGAVINNSGQLSIGTATSTENLTLTGNIALLSGGLRNVAGNTFLIDSSNVITLGNGGSTSFSLTGAATSKVGIGIAGASATAFLHIKAGTATASTAPLKFNSGVNLTTAEAGAMEYTDPLLYFTPTGTVRGVVKVHKSSRSTGQTAAVGSVFTYTLPATDASFEVLANVLVTTSSAEAFTVTVAYTDEGNTARTLTLNFQLVGGVIGTGINFANGAVPYEGIPVRIRAKASTAITIATTGTFTGATYNVEGGITQIS
jgi:hypothetical protein